MTEAEEAEIEAGYADVHARLAALRQAYGVRPWQREPWAPGQRNPHPVGSDESRKWAAVVEHGRALTRECREWSEKVGRVIEARIARNLADLGTVKYD